MPPRKKRRDAPVAEEPSEDVSEREPSSEDEGELESPPEDAAASGEQQPANLMDKRTADLSRGDKKEVHEAIRHAFAALKSDPTLYLREEFGYLRQFVDYVSTHRDQYPSMIGDGTLEANDGVGAGPPLTPGYIHMLSIGGDTSFASRVPSPIIDGY